MIASIGLIHVLLGLPLSGGERSQGESGRGTAAGGNEGRGRTRLLSWGRKEDEEDDDEDDEGGWERELGILVDQVRLLHFMYIMILYYVVMITIDHYRSILLLYQCLYESLNTLYFLPLYFLPLNSRVYHGFLVNYR